MLKFKGYDLKDKGIITDTLPKIQKAKKRIDIYEIYGRNGFLSVDNGTYNSWQLQVECHCSDNADMDEIAAFLDGYGTISFDGIKQSTAIVNNNIEFDKIRNSGFQKFILSFLVNPIFEDITPIVETLTFTAGATYYGTTLSVDTNANIYPDILEINISSDATIDFNGKSFTLKSGHYFLDCKMKEITDNDGDNASGKMDGNFPYLIDGTNNIKIYNENPTLFKITYRKTYLMG